MDTNRGNKCRMLDDLNREIRRLISHLGRKAPSYQPLSERDSIRLAHFSRIGSQLHCRLEHVAISQKPSYHALSYVWRWRPKTSSSQESDENASRPIFVDGRKVHVGANLADFIDTITQLWTTVPAFWVDAICINQNDAAEKSIQLQRMREIYENASRIVIWLGKHDDTSRRCIENMERWHTLSLDFIARYPTWDEMSKTSRDWLHEVGVFDSDGKLADRDAWVEFFQFFETRQWWHRIWTVQEYCTEVDTIFLCGDSTFTRRCLYEAMFLVKLILGSGTRDGLFSTNPIDAVMVTETFRREYHEKRQHGLTLYERWNGYEFVRDPMPLKRILSAWRFRSASDPRDKVFALLGFMEETLRNDLLLSIDCSLPTSSVFTNVAEYMLKTSKRLNWLGAVAPPNPTGPQCASWVPDWSNSGAASLDNMPRTVQHIPGVTPNGSWFLNLSDTSCPAYSPWPSGYPIPFGKEIPKIVQAPSGAQLHIEGIYLDMIVSLCDPSPDDGVPDISLITRWTEQLCSDQSTYPATKEPMLLAVLRTLALDVETLTPGEYIRPPKGLEELASLPFEEAVRRFIKGPPTESDETYEDRARHSNRQILMRGRRPAVTQYGFICMVPNHAEEEDCILALAGGMVLYVVRQAGWFPERYSFVGEAYMHGAMDDVVRESMRRPTFILV